MTTAAWGIPILFSSVHLWFDSHGAGRRGVAQTCPRNGSRRGPWHTPEESRLLGRQAMSLSPCSPPTAEQGPPPHVGPREGVLPQEESSEEGIWRVMLKEAVERGEGKGRSKQAFSESQEGPVWPGQELWTAPRFSNGYFCNSSQVRRSATAQVAKV